MNDETWLVCGWKSVWILDVKKLSLQQSKYAAVTCQFYTKDARLTTLSAYCAIFLKNDPCVCGVRKETSALTQYRMF